MTSVPAASVRNVAYWHQTFRVDFQRRVTGTKLATTAPATAIGGKWNSTTTCAAGTYDVWGELITVNNNKTVFVSKTPVVQNLAVK